MNKQEKQEFDKLRMRAEAAELLLGEKDAIIEELEEALDELREELGQTKKDDPQKERNLRGSSLMEEMRELMRKQELSIDSEFRWPDYRAPNFKKEKDWNKKSPPQHPPMGIDPREPRAMPEVKYRVKKDIQSDYIVFEIELVGLEAVCFRAEVWHLLDTPLRRRNYLEHITQNMLVRISEKLGLSPPSSMIIDMMVEKWEQELRKVGL